MSQSKPFTELNCGEWWASRKISWHFLTKMIPRKHTRLLTNILNLTIETYKCEIYSILVFVALFFNLFLPVFLSFFPSFFLSVILPFSLILSFFLFFSSHTLSLPFFFSLLLALPLILLSHPDFVLIPLTNIHIISLLSWHNN